MSIRLSACTAAGALLVLSAAPAVPAAQSPRASTARPAAGARAVAPRPLTPTELAVLYADATPFAAFVAGDTTRRAHWEEAYARGPAVAAAALRDGTAPAGRWRLLVVAESGCNDAVASIPFLARLAEALPDAELRLLRPDAAQPILQRHRYKGRVATPVVVVLDAQFRERGVWIERPAAQQRFVEANESRLSEDDLWAEVRRMRAADGGASASAEVLALIRAAAAPRSAAAAPPKAAGGASAAGTARKPATAPAKPDSGKAKAFEPIKPCAVP